MQDYMKSRAAHSLVVLPGRTADKGTPVELMRSEITDDCTDLLLSDASYDGVSITRRIVYLRHWDLTVVLDRVESEKPVQAEQRWHCGREVSAKALSLGFSLAHDDKTFHVAALTPNTKRDVRRGQEKPMVGWTATGWRKSTPVDVGTVYDEGTDLLFASVLGTWTPAAIDLLKPVVQELADGQNTISAILPLALVDQPWPGLPPRSPSPRSGDLTCEVRLSGHNVATARAEGPGRYFRFNLYRGAKRIGSSGWKIRPEWSFDLKQLRIAKLVILNRDGPSHSDRMEMHVGHDVDHG